MSEKLHKKAYAQAPPHGGLCQATACQIVLFVKAIKKYVGPMATAESLSIFEFFPYSAILDNGPITRQQFFLGFI